MGSFVHSPSVEWKAGDEEHPARLASWRVMNALSRKDKAAYISLYAVTGGLEDPVGPSVYDPSGEGHYGHDEISDFWDRAVEPIASFRFVIDDSFAAGDEVVNVGTITTALPDGKVMDIEGVFHYLVDPEGLLVSVRSFWEMDRATRTIRDS